MKQSNDSSRRGRSSRRGGGRRRGGSGRARGDKSSPTTIARMRAGTSEPEYAESIGDSLDLAIRQAVDILGAREDEVDVEVLQEGRRGFLWFSPKRPFRVRVTWQADQTHEEIVAGPVEDAPREPVAASPGPRSEFGGRSRERQRPERRESGAVETPKARPYEARQDVQPVGPVSEAETFVSGILSRMQLDAKLAGRDEDDGIRLRVSGGPAEAFLAERDGEVQSALQVLTHRVLSRRAERSVPVVIEIGETGPTHDSDLHATAMRLAEQVMTTSQPTETAPLSSPDRRIIHRTLADHPSVVTESQGRGLLKRVRISPR